MCHTPNSLIPHPPAFHVLTALMLSLSHTPILQPLQSRETRVKNPEQVARFGTLLLQHYRGKLQEEERECLSSPLWGSHFTPTPSADSSHVQRA
jgi:hypothetical protein